MRTIAQLATTIGAKVLFVGIEAYNWTVSDISKCAANARALGFDTIAMKRAEGTYKWYQTPGHLLLERQAALSEGCGFLPYGYLYGPRFGNGQIIAEANIQKEMAQQCDGLTCADMEHEWNGQVAAAQLFADQFKTFTGDMIISTWADPALQNWIGVLKVLNPVASAWSPQEYTSWLMGQEAELTSNGIPQSKLFPAIDITNAFAVNDPLAMMKLAVSRSAEKSIWIWEYQTAIANPSLVKGMLALMKPVVLPAKNVTMDVATGLKTIAPGLPVPSATIASNPAAPVVLPYPKAKVVTWKSYTILTGDTLSGIGTKLSIQNWYQNLYQVNHLAIEQAAWARGLASSNGGSDIFPGTVLKYAPGAVATIP